MLWHRNQLLERHARIQVSVRDLIEDTLIDRVSQFGIALDTALAFTRERRGILGEAFSFAILANLLAATARRPIAGFGVEGFVGFLAQSGKLRASGRANPGAAQVLIALGNLPLQVAVCDNVHVDGAPAESPACRQPMGPDDQAPTLRRRRLVRRGHGEDRNRVHQADGGDRALERGDLPGLDGPHPVTDVDGVDRHVLHVRCGVVHIELFLRREVRHIEKSRHDLLNTSPTGSKGRNSRKWRHGGAEGRTRGDLARGRIVQRAQICSRLLKGLGNLGP